MAVRGRLRELTLPNIIQINCMEGGYARLVLRRDEGTKETAELYFADGQVVHAQWRDRMGEEVVYELLKWQDGVFELDYRIISPKRTINVCWSALLFEGARRIDKGTKIDSKAKKYPVG